MDFEWDSGNRSKNLFKHKIKCKEAEECFNGDPLIYRDFYHSGNEERYICLGMTKHQRMLFIAFTIRGPKIRIISARPASRKERRLYDKKRS